MEKSLQKWSYRSELTASFHTRNLPYVVPQNILGVFFRGRGLSLFVLPFACFALVHVCVSECVCVCFVVLHIYPCEQRQKGTLGILFYFWELTYKG